MVPMLRMPCISTSEAARKSPGEGKWFLQYWLNNEEKMKNITTLPEGLSKDPAAMMDPAMMAKMMDPAMMMGGYVDEEAECGELTRLCKLDISVKKNSIFWHDGGSHGGEFFQ